VMKFFFCGLTEYEFRSLPIHRPVVLKGSFHKVFNKVVEEQEAKLGEAFHETSWHLGCSTLLHSA
jgi:hypothetical protein